MKLMIYISEHFEQLNFTNSESCQALNNAFENAMWFGLVGLFRKLFKYVQSEYCSQKLYPCVSNTFFKNCALVCTNNFLYKYEKNQCSLASGNCNVINRDN